MKQSPASRRPVTAICCIETGRRQPSDRFIEACKGHPGTAYAFAVIGRC